MSKQNKQLHIVCAAAVAVGMCSSAWAGITRYGTDDRDAWFNDVGVVGNADITTIGFTGFPAGTSITDQYRESGVIFDGNNFVLGSGDLVSYPQDGWGLRGLLDIVFEFDTPQNAISADYPGSLRFLLFLDGEQVGSEDFQTGGFGQFAGLISNVPFDKIVIDRLSGNPAFIDDIHFAFIPTPSGMIPLLLLCLVRRHGRRRSEPTI